MDQTQQSVRLVSNEFRQNRPGTLVNPIGDGADVETAQILEGIIRHIETISEAETAYDAAHESVLRACIGHWRILNDFADDETNDQEIFIVPIRNPFSVYWQPSQPDYGKKRWAFIVEDVPVEDYKGEYPDSTIFTGTGNAVPEWFTKEHVRVAEYFE